jgi:hypothetical protein
MENNIDSHQKNTDFSSIPSQKNLPKTLAKHQLQRTYPQTAKDEVKLR